MKDHYYSGRGKSMRFHISKSSTPNWWTVEDSENGVHIDFKNHDFNGSQKVTLPPMERPDASEAARWMREIADWLRANHYDKVF